MGTKTQPIVRYEYNVQIIFSKVYGHCSDDLITNFN